VIPRSNRARGKCRSRATATQVRIVWPLHRHDQRALSPSLRQLLVSAGPQHRGDEFLLAGVIGGC
jgi:hypothetical protein